jgi:hypothetical protein
MELSTIEIAILGPVAERRLAAATSLKSLSENRGSLSSDASQGKACSDIILKAHPRRNTSKIVDKTYVVVY